MAKDTVENGVRQSCPCALTEHHAMKAYWGVVVKLHAFFDLDTGWSKTKI